MLVIAERINSSRKSIAQAIANRDDAFIQDEAESQADAGGDYIDVNAGSFLGAEIKHLTWLVETVQEVVDLPLCLDSPDPEAIKAVLPLVRKTPMVNSITLEPARLEGILPVVAERQTKVIALCQSGETIAKTSDEKVRLAAELVEKTTHEGVLLGNLYLDPLVYPLSTNPNSAMASLKAIWEIMTRFPGVHTICGLTNVSLGLPNRKLINRTFLGVAVAMGLDAAILDPTDKRLFAALKAGLLIAGKDEFGLGFISAFREGRLD